MASKIFVSYKYGDTMVQPLPDNIFNDTTLNRSNYDALENFFEIDTDDLIHVFKNIQTEMSQTHQMLIQFVHRNLKYPNLMNFQHCNDDEGIENEMELSVPVYAFGIWQNIKWSYVLRDLLTANRIIAQNIATADKYYDENTEDPKEKLYLEIYNSLSNFEVFNLVKFCMMSRGLPETKISITPGTNDNNKKNVKLCK